MLYTAQEIGKLIRKQNDDRNAILQREAQSMEFVAATSEDPEKVRPEYDYAATQAALDVIDHKIRVMRHKLNIYNLNTVVEGFDMTIDQMLVYLPQLNEKKNKLNRMRTRLERQRIDSGYGRSAIIEYRYINYDLAEVEREYTEVADLLSRAQMALDRVNAVPAIELAL